MLRGSRIAVAIVIGILLGGFFAVLYPHGLFITDPPANLGGRLGKSVVQVRITAQSSH